MRPVSGDCKGEVRVSKPRGDKVSLTTGREQKKFVCFGPSIVTDTTRREKEVERMFCHILSVNTCKLTNLDVVPCLLLIDLTCRSRTDPDDDINTEEAVLLRSAVT